MRLRGIWRRRSYRYVVSIKKPPKEYTFRRFLLYTGHMRRNTRLSVISILGFCLVFLLACKSSVASADRGKVFKCLTLDPERDYIFYQVVTPANDNEIWAIDTTGKRSILLPEEMGSVQMTNPPGRNWILLGNHSINILDPDTCKAQPIYRLDSTYKSIYTIWLSRDVLLISAFEEWPFSPDLYALDLETNKAEKVAAEKWIQAASASQATWIQADGITVESVKWLGKTRRILENFEVNVENSPGAIQFLPNSDEFIFVAARKNSRDFKIWKSNLRQRDPQIIFETNPDSPLRYYQLSPDGKYLGLIVDSVVDSSYGYSMFFLNIRTNQIDFEWPYPPTRTNPELSWSPDSRHVAILFEGDQELDSSASHIGIQILEIETGKFDTLMETGVTWLLGWYSGR